MRLKQKADIIIYMKHSASDIQHLAGLSGLTLSDDEAKALDADIETIINYIDVLDELDVSGVEPTYQVIDLVNVSREDEVNQGGVSKDQLLALSKDVKENQVKVPRVL